MERVVCEVLDDEMTMAHTDAVADVIYHKLVSRDVALANALRAAMNNNPELFRNIVVSSVV